MTMNDAEVEASEAAYNLSEPEPMKVFDDGDEPTLHPATHEPIDWVKSKAEGRRSRLAGHVIHAWVSSLSSSALIAEFESLSHKSIRESGLQRAKKERLIEEVGALIYSKF